MSMLDNLTTLFNQDDKALAALAPEEPESSLVLPGTGHMLEPKDLKKLNSSRDGGAIKELLKKTYGQAKDDRNTRQHKWYENLAFERGDHYVYWDKNAAKLAAIPRTDAHTPRLTINLMRPITRTEISKWTTQRPTAVSMPASNEDEDWRASLAAEQLWGNLYDRLNYARTLRKTARWMSTLGLGFQKVCWDEFAFDRVNEVYGDLQIKSVSPFNIFVPDLSEEDLEEQVMVLEVYTIPNEQALLRYPDILPKDHGPTVNARDEVVDLAYLGLSGQVNAKPQSNRVIEGWIKPGMFKRFPDGGFVTMLDEYIVEASIDNFPLGYPEYPYVKFEHITNGTFYPASVYDDAIPIQREINRTHSQIIENKNRMAKMQMMYRAGSTDPQRISSKAGQWIEVKQGFDYPAAVPIQPLPSYVQQELADLMMVMEDISAQHSSTRGRHQPGLDAATAIAFMTEQDESMLSASNASLEEGVTGVARRAITLFAAYCDTPRLVKITGEDNGFDVIELQGSDVARGTDIRVEAGSALSGSRSARQALVIDLMKYGALPPDDALTLIDMPQLNNYNQTRDRKADENKARRENIRFSRMTAEEVEAHYTDWKNRQQKGDPATFSQDPELDALGMPIIDPVTQQPKLLPLAPPPVVTVDELDDHAEHLRIHSLKRKSQSYELMDDTQKAELDKHIKIHQQALVNQMMAQLPPGTQPAGDAGGASGGGMASAPDYTGMNEQQIAAGPGGEGAAPLSI